ncbi:PQQ-binding-like beta-propeller repeat protein [Couchioplanes caeruleus]|uniref:Putative pyrroloquinoline-quinone binding quinoprotein n=1 Tax=Couchioplanes caeruleus TaxID=56438 RepID=A0A3N1FTB0_9ACTN|nr:PQQ-binding-like beta-propeller repeat protein [Couchioplanes caeruleus]ROP21233.1 putative pyrroloquinoline-quinone binding quinoprotein [Couchioplanes caeruleus]
MRDRRLAAGALLTVLAVAGCTSDPAPPPAPGPTSSAPARPTFDPPTRFGPTAIKLGPARASDVLLYAGMAYAAGESSTTVTDVLTGRRLPALTPQHPPVQRPGGLGEPVGHIPLLVQRDGRPAVVIAYAVSTPASGTTTAKQSVQLLLADAASGQQLAALSVAATPAEGGGDFTAVAGEYVTVVGAQANTLVLTVGKQVTLGVDLTTGSVLWRNTTFTAAAVLGDTVVGLTAADSSVRQQLVGLGVADGATRWRAANVRNAELAAAGTAYAVLVAEQDTGGRFYARINADGKLNDREAGSYGSGLGCRYDQASVTVCSIGTTAVFALDATDGKLLWQLPATGRTAPNVTAVWHGAVYGTTGTTTPVVLDARTGADREAAPGLAPVAVSGYAGVGVDPAEQNTVTAYPAVG